MNEMPIIFTDGSSRGNPGPGGWGAVIVLKIEGKILELGGFEKQTTNNRMELLSCIEALRKTISHGFKEVILYSDSSYVRNGAMIWTKGWEKNGWITKEKKDVLNRDLWQELLSCLSNIKVDWKEVPGHAGVPLNERCDEIATLFADGKNPFLYEGSIERYGVSVVTPEVFFKSAEKGAPILKKKGIAYSYVTKIGGSIRTFKTWKECEQAVKGVPGARWKKAFSKSDEDEIIKSFSA